MLGDNNCTRTTGSHNNPAEWQRQLQQQWHRKAAIMSVMAKNHGDKSHWGLTLPCPKTNKQKCQADPSAL